MNYNDVFDLNTLQLLKDFKNRINYCKKKLGEPIGEGAGRIVFTIDEEKVIKLAKNKSGLKQNKNEYTFFSYGGEQLFARIYAKDDDYKWIISQKAKKATYNDFIEIFDAPFTIITDYIDYLNHKVFRSRKYNELLKAIQNQENNNDNIFFVLSNFYKISPLWLSDVGKLSSWGVINNNGKKQLVIIDYGVYYPKTFKEKLFHAFFIPFIVIYALFKISCLFFHRIYEFLIAIIKFSLKKDK